MPAEPVIRTTRPWSLDDPVRPTSMPPSFPFDFETFADSLSVGVAVRHPDGRLLAWNPRLRELLFGDRWPDVGFDWCESIEPVHRRDFDALVDRAQRKGEKGAVTLRWQHPRGKELWLRVNVGPWPIQDADERGTIVMIDDVTEENESRETVGRLAQMLDSTRDYVAVFRPDGSPLYVNEMTRNALDALRVDGYDGVLTDLVDPNRLDDLVLGIFGEIEQRGHWRGEFPIRIGGGVEVPVSAVGVTRRDAHGNLEWFAFLGRDMSSEKRLEERLRRQAAVDPLTALANRTKAISHLDEAVDRHHHQRSGVGVLYCDLDGFKLVNDIHGHSIGDGVLIAIARRLTGAVRTSDVVARIGGDEFIVVVEDVERPEQLEELAERLIDSLIEPITIRSETFGIGVSIGIALMDERAPVVSADEVLNLADAAMYRAKQSGGDTYRLVTVGRQTADP